METLVFGDTGIWRHWYLETLVFGDTGIYIHIQEKVLSASQVLRCSVMGLRGGVEGGSKELIYTN